MGRKNKRTGRVRSFQERDEEDSDSDFQPPRTRPKKRLGVYLNLQQTDCLRAHILPQYIDNPKMKPVMVWKAPPVSLIDAVNALAGTDGKKLPYEQGSEITRNCVKAAFKFIRERVKKCRGSVPATFTEDEKKLLASHMTISRFAERPCATIDGGSCSKSGEGEAVLRAGVMLETDLRCFERGDASNTDADFSRPSIFAEKAQDQDACLSAPDASCSLSFFSLYSHPSEFEPRNFSPVHLSRCSFFEPFFQRDPEAFDPALLDLFPELA